MGREWHLRLQARRALSEALLEACIRRDVRAQEVLGHFVEHYLQLGTAQGGGAERFAHLADATESIRRRVGGGVWDRA